MANRIDGRPWVLDFPSPIPVKKGRVWTTGFVYRDYTTPGDKAVIMDGVRNLIVAELTGNADLTPVGETWFHPQQIQDFILLALPSGHLDVIVK